MKDKQSKKVVIIHDIQSDAIEQAILILRNAGAAEPAPCGQTLVEEARSLIRSYIKATEKNRKIAAKQARRAHPENGPSRRKTFLRFLWVAGAAAGFLAAGYFVSHAMTFILEKF